MHSTKDVPSVARHTTGRASSGEEDKSVTEELDVGKLSWRKMQSSKRQKARSQEGPLGEANPMGRRAAAQRGFWKLTKCCFCSWDRVLSFTGSRDRGL